MKLVLTGLVAVLLFLTGCSGSIINPVTPSQTTTTSTISTTSTNSTTTTKISNIDAEAEARLINDNWVSPAEVKIANYYPGAKAEWAIRIHNGNDAEIRKEAYRVGTEANETVVPIKVKFPIAAADYTKVTVTSDNTGETLIPTAYNEETTEVTISGFLPEVTRVITLTYTAWTEYLVDYETPNRTREGYSGPQVEAEDWIIIADTTPVLAPKETREILVTLAIPKGATVEADKWEFWTSVTAQGQGNIQTEMATRWLVTMR